MKIRKLLVANRGEIAIRVIRAAREMNIRTVAVFSEADAGADHVAYADESVLIGPGEATQSYLSMDKVLDAVRSSGADAVHPGYGFLSERAEFAGACERAGITFVGPSAAAMKKLGSKIEAKELAVANGVPVVPGLFHPGATFEELKEAAGKIGYPVLLKASAGGGGRGMRVVRDSGDFDNEFDVATHEAQSAFGNGAMMVEKLIQRPRHIEIQVLADQAGTVACIYERECSIQRRHQKLIEEAPSPMAEYESVWPAMREAAQKLTRAANYVGAGTVEFIVDPSSQHFYFLEVNARLQVEHPVTEAISGLDIVQWQIRIAQGESLDIPAAMMTADRSGINGHAIEARIIAEDPARGFLPSAGKIIGWALPQGPGIRVDTGYRLGAQVPRFYDSLLAKVIAHSETREGAIRRLKTALEDLHILGVRTNVAYLIEILESADFLTGEIDTGYLDRFIAELETVYHPSELGDIVNAATQTRESAVTVSANSPNSWDLNDSFRNV
jgi:acetyl/propionyl-CoA carboxylase alpha subunit